MYALRPRKLLTKISSFTDSVSGTSVSFPAKRTSFEANQTENSGERQHNSQIQIINAIPITEEKKNSLVENSVPYCTKQKQTKKKLYQTGKSCFLCLHEM